MIETEIISIGGEKCTAKVPEVEYIVANKLGFADWKNVYDVGILVPYVDMDKVAQIISGTDNWKDVVRRRLSRFRNEIKNPGNIAYLLLISSDIDLKEYSDFLKELNKKIQ